MEDLSNNRKDKVVLSDTIKKNEENSQLVTLSSNSLRTLCYESNPEWRALFASQKWVELAQNENWKGKEFAANQLSAQGLSLLSYYEAIKRQEPNQPLIAFSISSLIRLSQLILQAQIPNGTKFNVIFCPSDFNAPDMLALLKPYPFYDSHNLSVCHKTVLHICKQKNVIDIVNVDSISECLYGFLAARVIYLVMVNQPIDLHKKIRVFVEGYCLKRQTDHVSCGTFSAEIADAFRKYDYSNLKCKGLNVNPEVIGLEEYEYKGKGLFKAFYKNAMSEVATNYYVNLSGVLSESLLLNYSKYTALGIPRIRAKEQRHILKIKDVFEREGPQVCLKAISQHSAEHISAEDLFSNYVSKKIKYYPI